MSRQGRRLYRRMRRDSNGVGLYKRLPFGPCPKGSAFFLFRHPGAFFRRHPSGGGTFATAQRSTGAPTAESRWGVRTKAKKTLFPTAGLTDAPLVRPLPPVASRKREQGTRQADPPKIPYPGGPDAYAFYPMAGRGGMTRGVGECA